VQPNVTYANIRFYINNNQKTPQKKLRGIFSPLSVIFIQELKVNLYRFMINDKNGTKH